MRQNETGKSRGGGKFRWEILVEAESRDDAGLAGDRGGGRENRTIPKEWAAVMGTVEAGDRRGSAMEALP